MLDNPSITETIIDSIKTAYAKDEKNFYFTVD